MDYDFNKIQSLYSSLANGKEAERAQPTTVLTGDWGDPVSVSSYLHRCQVDTPMKVVVSTWQHVRKHRPGQIGKVVDLGAGDGRFARHGSYESYVGYEIDEERCSEALLPYNAELITRCAFSENPADADVCVGNPPFARNQQIPSNWRQHVHGVVRDRTGVSLSGLANAWQYFFLNALACLKNDGLAALIVPFEWVYRPSAEALRSYIRDQRWNVYVYRLLEPGFAQVLTTASISIIDKARRDGKWEFYDETPNRIDRVLESPSGSKAGVLRYLRAADVPAEHATARRGLSPGNQKALTLTEAQRTEHSLSRNRDVAPCITSLRHLPTDLSDLDYETFAEHYVQKERRCWLIKTDSDPSEKLSAYLSSVPASERQTKTCLGRPEWWRFKMPVAPSMLFAQGFRGKFPKVVRNSISAHAVGGVCGIYNANERQIEKLTGKLCGMDLRNRVVPYSSGFYKVEINQINALLATSTLKADR